MLQFDLVNCYSIQSGFLEKSDVKCIYMLAMHIGILLLFLETFWV